MGHDGMGELVGVVAGGQVGQIGHSEQLGQLVGGAHVRHGSQVGQEIEGRVGVEGHVTVGGHVGKGGHVGQVIGGGVGISEQFGHNGHGWGDGTGGQVGQVTGGGHVGVGSGVAVGFSVRQSEKEH